MGGGAVGDASVAGGGVGGGGGTCHWWFATPQINGGSTSGC